MLRPHRGLFQSEFVPPMVDTSGALETRIRIALNRRTALDHGTANIVPAHVNMGERTTITIHAAAPDRDPSQREQFGQCGLAGKSIATDTSSPRATMSRQLRRVDHREADALSTTGDRVSINRIGCCAWLQ